MSQRNSLIFSANLGNKIASSYEDLGVQSVKNIAEPVHVWRVLLNDTVAASPKSSDLWAERYKQPLRDISALQDEIVQRIATTLNLEIAVHEQGFLFRRATNSLDAFDDFLRGMDYSLNTYGKEGNARARQMWRKAVVLDPGYADAYVFMGLSYFNAKDKRAA